MLHCAGCHGFDGSGAPDKGVPNMRGAVGHFVRLEAGRALLVQVPGVVNTPLNDEQVARLTNWMLRDIGGASVPPDTPPYTAAEVHALRLVRPNDIAQVRRDLVAQLRALGHDVEAAAPTAHAAQARP